jgi:hypothetical protein
MSWESECDLMKAGLDSMEDDSDLMGAGSEPMCSGDCPRKSDTGSR